MSGKLLPFINFNLLAWVCFHLVWMGKILMMTMMMTTMTIMMILCTSFSCVQSNGKYNFNFDDEWVGLIMKIEIEMLQVDLITMGSSFMNPPI